LRIIGIDPGTICCGYGIVERRVKNQESGKKPKLVTHNAKLKYIIAGDVKLNKKHPLPERLKILYESLCAIVDKYRPTQLSLEKIFYHKSIRSAFALGSTRGVVLLLAAQYNLPVFEYNPTEVKMALTGYGRAEKSQVQEMVKIILDLKSSPQAFSEDSTDSLALCICHIHSSSFNNKAAECSGPRK
jgi:crossover junction endodeoxyribonuclease RuvC